REGRLSLRQLFEGRKSRSEIIGIFLAILELVREKKILVTQSDKPNEIDIQPASEEHRKSGQLPMHLADEPKVEGAKSEDSQPEEPVESGDSQGAAAEEDGEEDENE
ncbi:MAG: segregation/condensation protein A, partial [Bacillota bacterium]